MIKAYTIDATVTAVWALDPAFDIEHKVDPETLRDELRDAIDRVRKGGTTGLPESGHVLGFLAYQITAPVDPGSWRDLLKVRDGQKPTEFVIGAIPAPELNRIEHELEGAPRYLACFKEAVRTIENGPADTVDGRPEVPREQRDGYQVVKGSWVDRVFVRDARRIANDIGRLAWAWNQLGEPDVKN